VRILVGTGEDARTFIIPAACLSSRSLFFKKALSDDWKEAGERIIKLPEDEGDTFELYLSCVFGQKLAVEPDPVPAGYGGLAERFSLAKLYVFSEKVQDVRTKNTCLKAFVEIVWKVRDDGGWLCPNKLTIKLLYRGTMPGSPMRKFLVDTTAYAMTCKEPLLKGYPSEFLAEVVAEMTKTRLTGSFKEGHLQYGDKPDAYMETEDEVSE
jgi:hypothetical protein